MQARVLFVCIQNSGRSQMAEAWLNSLSEGEIKAQSAGFKPANINPLVVTSMLEEGIDISNNESNSVFEFFKEGRRYNYIITVCDEGSAQQCPIFPGVTHRIHWSFEDPTTFEGTEAEKLQKINQVRDDIKKHVTDFIQLVKTGEIKENAPKDWKFGK